MSLVKFTEVRKNLQTNLIRSNDRLVDDYG